MLFYKQESADCKALEQSQDGYFSFINTPYTVCQIIRQVFYEFVIKSCLPMILNVTLVHDKINYTLWTKLTVETHIITYAIHFL